MHGQIDVRKRLLDVSLMHDGAAIVEPYAEPVSRHRPRAASEVVGPKGTA